MTVDSLARPGTSIGVSYRLVSGSTEFEPDSLRYQEAEKAVKQALAGRGMYEAPDPVSADVTISVDYGISEPRVTVEQQSRPRFEYRPGPIYAQQVLVGRTPLGVPIYTTVYSQGPDVREYAGEEYFNVRVVVYEKHLRLSARETQKAGADAPPEGELWSVEVTSEGPNNNLRGQLPVLAAATMSYVGKDTKGQKVVRLKDHQADVSFVEKGL